MIGSGHRVLAVLAILAFAETALAQPVIPPDQESRVLALLEPHGLAGEPVDGWRLAEVAIERSFIRLRIARGEGRASLSLHHPDAIESAERTASFALEREGDSAEAIEALDPWVAALRANDDGRFWEALPPPSVVRHGTGGAPRNPPWDALDRLPVAVALLLVVLLLAWERRRFGPEAASSASIRRTERRWGLLLASGLALAAAVGLWLTASAPPLHPDTTRDLLLARDCLRSGVCLGPSTSFGDLDQHGGWTRLLAGLRGLGLGPVGIHGVLIAANALGAGLLAYVAARRLALPFAALAAALAFSWLVWCSGFPILWNPTLSPLAHALLIAGALERRWWIAGLLGGLGAVGAIETHVAGVVALAPLVLALRALADRPGRALAVAVGLFVLLELALSAPALATNLATPMARRVVLPAIVGALGASLFVGGWLRRRFGDERRTLAVLTLWVLGTTGPPLMAAMAAGHFFTARYFVSAVAPAAGLVAVGLAWLAVRGWRRGVASVLALLALGLSASPWAEAANRQYYDLAEVGAIADALEVERDYPRVRLSLRGPLADLLGEGLAVWAGSPAFDPVVGAPTVRVVRVGDPELLPAGWRAVPLPGGATAGVSELRSWLRPEVAEVCLTSEPEPACLTLSRETWRAFGGERRTYERFASGLLPAAEALRERAVGTERATLFMRIPIVTDGSDPERSLQLFDDLGDAGGWRVARVEGVAHRGQLGGRRVTLIDGGQGTLTLEHSAPVGHYLPPLILDALELRPNERPLRDTLCAHFFGCPPN